MNIIDYQKEAVEFINRAFETNHLSHAYIFEGEAGSGGLELAYYFSEMLFCEEKNACGKCDECKRVKTRVHPNIFLIEPVQEVIKKDQINSIIHEGQMTSVINPERVYIIKDVEKMNKTSSNTLLKTLEEPNSNNYLILLSSNSENLLETITSRCQIIRLKPINKAEIRKLLESENIDSDTSFLLSEVFGSFDAALDAFSNQSNLFDHINKMFNAIVSNKDLYIEYYLNKNVFSSFDSSLIFLQSLIVFIKEELKYLHSNNVFFLTKFNKLDKNYIYEDQLIKQIESINESINELKSNVYVDLVYAKLFQSFRKE